MPDTQIAPHDGHVFDTFAPHSPQNFEPSDRVEPHLLHLSIIGLPLLFFLEFFFQFLVGRFRLIPYKPGLQLFHKFFNIFLR